jgi:hypothetical protein
MDWKNSQIAEVIAKVFNNGIAALRAQRRMAFLAVIASI